MLKSYLKSKILKKQSYYLHTHYLHYVRWKSLVTSLYWDVAEMGDLEPDLNSNVQNREKWEGELAEDNPQEEGAQAWHSGHCHVSEEHTSAYIH